MNTEKHIVYEIFNALRKHEHNNDEPVSERLMRGYVKSFRGDLIRKYSKNGININDECRQTMSLILIKNGKNIYSAKIPKTIRLDNNSGISVLGPGVVIPVVDNEQFELSKRNPFGRKNPFCKTVHDDLTVYIPDLSTCTEYGTPLYNFIQSHSKNIAVTAVFADPSDVPGYDWENDIYPFPAEKEFELIYQILRQIFGISEQMPKDEIQNARADRIIYQNEYNVNGGQQE